MENIYLISCSSYRLLEDEINKIVKGNPYTSYDLNYQSLDDVLEEANYYSLFDEKKYMVIKNANIFGTTRKSQDDAIDDNVSKKDENLLKYLEEPNPNNVVIFTTSVKPNSKKKVFKLIDDKYKYIRIEELSINDIASRIDKLFKKDGYKCSKEIEYYIINNSQNNYDLSFNEVEKIKLFYNNPCQVLQKDVTNIISKPMEDNNFAFIDHVISKNIKTAFADLDDLVRQKVEPSMLLILLANDYRNVLLVKKYSSYSKLDAIKSFNIKYDFQYDIALKRSYNYTVKELEDILLYLANLDYKIKSGSINSRRALELFILYICK